MRVLRFIAQFLLLCCVTQHAQATSFATQLTFDNLSALQPRGPDAIAGLGDWVIGNGTLCAAVSDIEHESGFNPFGGSLVDLYHCDRGDDQWPFQHALPNLDKDRPLRPQRIFARTTEDSAQLTVTARGYGLAMSSLYSVSDNSPRELMIEHRLQRIDDGPAVNLFGVLTLHPNLSLTPYSLDTRNPLASSGFDHAAIDDSSPLSQLASMIPADTQVLVGNAPLGEISYGVQLLQATLIGADGDGAELSQFQQTSPTYSLQGLLARPPWLSSPGALGLWEFTQSRLMDLRRGEELRVQQRMLLGERADVASITDQLFNGPLITGRVDSSKAVVHVNAPGGAPLTVVKVDEQGAFSAQLPAGIERVGLHVHSPWGKVDLGEHKLTARETALGELKVLPPSQVLLPRGETMRLVFRGIDGTPDPNFNDNLLNFRRDGARYSDGQAANYINLAGLASDRRRVPLAAGRYRVLATRGPAYSVTETSLEVAPGTEVNLAIEPPQQVVATRDWVAADFHVHSAASFDSYIPFNERLRGFVAQGGQVLVASEHNALIDYQRDVATMGLVGAVEVVGGIELTGMARTEQMPETNGHLNAFPLAAAPREFAGGLMPHEGKRLRTLHAALRARNSDVLIQMNHPRMEAPQANGRDNAYFDHLVSGEPFDPALPLSDAVNSSLIEPDPQTGLRDLDFELMEIANGKNYNVYKLVRQDWLALLAAGERIFGTANSDSHGEQQLVAIPQNFVRLEGSYSEKAFLDAVRNGRMFGSTGPFLDVSVVDASGTVYGPGDTVQGSNLQLTVIVEAADWIPVSTVTVYQGNSVVHEAPMTAGGLSLPLTANEDSFVIVEVTGEATEPYSSIAPGFVPMAFSNPVFIDVP